jgi:hypothetical protein
MTCTIGLPIFLACCVVASSSYLICWTAFGFVIDLNKQLFSGYPAIRTILNFYVGYLSAISMFIISWHRFLPVATGDGRYHNSLWWLLLPQVTPFFNRGGLYTCGVLLGLGCLSLTTFSTDYYLQSVEIYSATGVLIYVLVFLFQVVVAKFASILVQAVPPAAIDNRLLSPMNVWQIGENFSSNFYDLVASSLIIAAPWTVAHQIMLYAVRMHGANSALSLLVIPCFLLSIFVPATFASMRYSLLKSIESGMLY